MIQEDVLSLLETGLSINRVVNKKCFEGFLLEGQKYFLSGSLKRFV